ncbi:A24 family peptidase [Roseobacter sp. YSTF-M11]|uniref:A24 family peptidase n=1 Tax=Roseobacter insulae TaxID=2859783 RepID=A0A9X1FTC7_9RHOB|nr:A24 family peptidase [Roseobacter insulae]MBW4707420.1 A24 family peptidase [Roseobacter insulae]
MIEHPDPVQIFATIWLLALLGWVSLYDLRYLRIPNAANALLAVSGIVTAMITTAEVPLAHVWGALLGFGVFAALGAYYHRRTGDDGLGLGDAKLLGAAGAWLGWAALPGVVALSALSALAYALVLKRRKLAFGPWLSASFLLHWMVSLPG